MNDKPIEVLLYPATGDKKPERRTLEPVPTFGLLKAMQDLVDGFIAGVPYPGNKDLLIVGDIDGKFKNKPLNRAFLVDGHIQDYVFGDFFVCRQDGEDTVSLTEEDIEWLLNEYTARRNLMG